MYTTKLFGGWEGTGVVSGVAGGMAGVGVVSGWHWQVRVVSEARCLAVVVRCCGVGVGWHRC
ncbi:hypothetical protein DEO72_LG8g331 [Vigna unguiculata]|uniref:Uncharacterized protein n=1 Tax=Vigna unguiculata TaxID=3917 RepID=A0A4D6ML68_VIGUN|nr:hypothetical protein DEO72_LG8g331 [Vigna unguiculata]